MGLARFFWLIAVFASVAVAVVMARPLFIFGGYISKVSGSSGRGFKVYGTAPVAEKTLAIINHLYTFAMVSSIAYLLFLLFNASPVTFPAIAVLMQCLFITVFRGTGLAGRMQRQFIENEASQDFIGDFLSKNTLLIIILALLHMGSLVSLIYAGIGGH